MDNTIVDLFLTAVLLLFAWLGARKGLIRSMMLLVSTLLALVGAALLTAALVEPVTNAVFPKVEEKVVVQFEKLLAESQDAGTDDAQSPEEPETGGLLPDGVAQALGGAIEKLKRFGVADDAIDRAMDHAADSFHAAAEQAAYLLVKTIVQAVLFLVLFLALLLVLKLVTHALDALCGLPVLNTLNTLGGAALSLVEGALVIYLVLYLAPRFGVTWFADHADGTHLLAWFMNHTPYTILASLT